MNLDVGEFPDLGNDVGDEDDPERLTRLLAHAIARVGDRFSFVRKLSRHMEGTEKRAGLISDLLSAAYVLYRRNPQVVETLALNYKRELEARRAIKKVAPMNGNGPTEGVTSHASR